MSIIKVLAINSIVLKPLICHKLRFDNILIKTNLIHLPPYLPPISKLNSTSLEANSINTFVLWGG